MPRDSSVYFDDILTATARITSYVEGMSRESFANDLKTVDAVVRDLADVQELIQARDLPLDLCDELDPSVREKYTEL